MLSRIKERFVRWAYPFGAIRRIRRGLLRGCRYKVAPGMGFTYAWHINGEQWSGLARFVPAGSIAYDIGANRGQSTLYLAAAVGETGQVFAFEPMPDVFADLERNLQLNEFCQVTSVNAAAADRDGTAEFLFDPDYPTQGKLKAVEPTNTVATASAHEVRLLRLDDWACYGWPIPSFIKIDVEGGAGAVLRGAQSLLAAARPVIHIELHGPEERKAVQSLLLSHGYHCHDAHGSPVRDVISFAEGVLVCHPDPITNPKGP